MVVAASRLFVVRGGKESTGAQAKAPDDQAALFARDLVGDVRFELLQAQKARQDAEAKQETAEFARKIVADVRALIDGSCAVAEKTPPLSDVELAAELRRVPLSDGELAAVRAAMMLPVSERIEMMDASGTEVAARRAEAAAIEAQMRTTAAPATMASLLTFGDAIAAVKTGQKVARLAWKPGRWLCYISPFIAPAAMVPSIIRALVPDGDLHMAGYLVIFEPGESRGTWHSGWTAGADDLIAEDWRIIPR